MQTIYYWIKGTYTAAIECCDEQYRLTIMNEGIVVLYYQSERPIDIKLADKILTALNK